MARALKLFNGRAHVCWNTKDPIWDGVNRNGSMHAYVAAYSRADARRVIQEYCGHLPSDSELRDYWHEGAWGNSMDGVTPERGLWLKLEKDYSAKPVKVYPQRDLERTHGIE